MENKKNILIVTSSFPCWPGDSSGPFIYNLSESLLDFFNVTVLAPHFTGAKKKENWSGVSIYRFRYFWPSYFEKVCHKSGILPNIKKNKFLFLIVPFLFLFQFIAVWRLVKREKIDLINAHWILPAGFSCFFVSKLLKKPLVLTTHGPDIYALLMKGFFSPISKKIVKGADCLTATSLITAKIMADSAEIDHEKISVISMGVDSDLFEPSQKLKEEGRIKLSKKIHLKPSRPVILFIARLAKHKGADYLIEAMPEIIRKFPKTNLIIVGQGPEKESLKKLAIQLKVNDNIYFLGKVPNKELPYYYNQADVFVLPSLREGLPVVLMEAMSSGCPVVATNIAGNPDMIESGQNGFLIKTKSPKKISKAILDILSDDKLKNRFIRNARETIIERYSWNVIAKRFKNVFDKNIDSYFNE